MAMLHVSRIVAPNLWGWLADRSGRRVQIVRFGALMTCILFLAIFFQEGALGIGLVMLGFSFFWNAVLPQFEVITLNQLGQEKSRYSQIRLWGSIGFIITVSGIGALLDLISIRWLPWLMLGLMLLIWLNTLLIPEEDPVPVDPQQRGRGRGFQSYCCGLRYWLFHHLLPGSVWAWRLLHLLLGSDG